MTKATELRKRDHKELHKTIKELQGKLSELRFAFSANKLKNVKELRNTKKEVARIMTILNEKKA